MIYVVGETFYVGFTINNSTGAAVDADSLPTASLLRNGAIDGAVTVTVANLSTGAYRASFAVPGGYVAGDDVQILISATVGGIAAKAFKGQGRVGASVDGVPAAVAAITIAELGVGVPSATPTLAQAMALLYMALRNRTVTTANLHQLHNDAGTKICEASVSEVAGVSLTRGELG